MNKTIYILPLLFLLGSSVSARTYHPINEDWHFKKLDKSAAQLQSVNLPHTYNALDADDGGSYYRGPALYKRDLQLLCASDETAYIEFDGAATRTEVFVNSRFIGRHDGAYTAFRFRIPKEFVQTKNTLSVITDNSHFETVAPLGGDFSVFGGIYADVRLVCVREVHFDMEDYGSTGVYVSSSLTGKQAELNISLRLKNLSSEHRQGYLNIDVIAPDNNKPQREQIAYNLNASELKVFKHTVKIDNPVLWDGVNNPALYTLRSRVISQAGVELDSIDTPFGIRTIEIDAQKGLLLNGKIYRAHGVNLHHSQRPGKGNAVSAEERAQDFRILDDLGVTALRLAHYPHPQAVYHHADQQGYLVWSEIPLVAKANASAEFIGNIEDQLREMIRQNYNHPSVFVWGLGNEIYDAGPEAQKVMQRLQQLAKSEDPNRYTVYANCCGAVDQAIAVITDLNASNIYHGWYPQQKGEMGAWLDEAHAKLGKRALAVSEHGAGGSVLHQEDPPARPETTAMWHPEQYQSLVHEANWLAMKSREYLWASFVWVAFDFASDGRSEGDRAGINDKGLVTYDRLTKKDAFYWYKANWSAEPVLHITSRRLKSRKTAEVEVKVYSNLDELVLFVNNRKISAQHSDNNIFKWKITLEKGQNVVKVRATNSTLEDVVSWELM